MQSPRFPEFNDSRGSEPVSFALVAPLVMFLVLGILQFSLVLWVKTTLIDAAGAGAHAVAVVGAPESAAETTVRGALASTIGERYVTGVSVSRIPVASVSNKFSSSEVEVVEVKIEAPIPILGLFGAGSLSSVGHAMVEVGP